MIEKETALKYLAAGLAVLPADRTLKRPDMAWKNYQERRPTECEVNAWFSNRHDALCLVCGKTSGNLEVIDFDNHGELFDAWQNAVPTDLKSKLVIENTPSGGFHAAYQCDDSVCGNVKLAQGIRNDKIVTLIETRGEGGLILCSPSDGYTLTQGDYADLPILTAEERDVLLNAARQLNEIKEEEHSALPDTVVARLFKSHHHDAVLFAVGGRCGEGPLVAGLCRAGDAQFHLHCLFLPEDFFESVAAGDEFLERVFALGEHPARAVEGDAVCIVCLGK